MEKLNNFNSFENFINRNFKISLVFFALGLFFGIIYSINLLGFSINSETLNPMNMRAIHISLMLYGFVPLMLSYLPFLLINKEVGCDKEGLRYLNLYTIIWFIFLVFMVVSLLLGKSRGLAFYDFAYELNFLLAIAGVFYIIALYKFIRLYKNALPLWIKVCLRVVIIAPIALLILMNPIIGQVESTVSGPHGDNTLGMSLALIPIYYLIIKLLNIDNFKARWNIFWIIPTVFYFGSVLHRIVLGPLTYNQEWFLQYLTLLYVPLLYKWFKDSDILPHVKKALLISILAFLFVDVEGNIIFIPEIRWLFHRNDLIVAHAHVAMGIAVFFMVISMFITYIKELQKAIYLDFYLFALLGIFTVLSISGFTEAGFINIPTENLWVLRTIFGLFALAFIFAFIKIKYIYSKLELYNIAGILSDGVGGVFLILFASFIYPLVGFTFSGIYEYVVFAFVSMTGVIHFMALKNPTSQIVLTNLSVIIRVFAGSMFFALYASGKLGFEALAICLFDLIFVFVYLIFFYEKEKLCKD
jgi:cytochrome c oxidase cbb3-type subunit I